MRAWLLIVWTGCSFRLTSAPADVPVDVADVVDAAVDGPPIDTVSPTPCIAKWLDHTVTLAPPSAVPGINVSGMSERDPFLLEDERVIFWVSPGPNGNDDVYQAQRGSAMGSFGSNVVKQTLSDDNQHDSKVAITSDGFYAIQATSRTGGQGLTDLWRATRDSGGGDPFDSIDQVHLAAVNDGGYQLDPFVSADGLSILFAIGSPQRIVVSTRASPQDDFGAPVDLPGVNGGTGDADPALSSDGRVLLWTSNSRPGGFDYADIWYATRDDAAGVFGQPRMVPAINGMHVDGDAHLSADGCRLYFASARTTGTYNLMVSAVQ